MPGPLDCMQCGSPLPLAEITSVVLSSILFRKIYLDKIKPLGQAAA